MSLLWKLPMCFLGRGGGGNKGIEEDKVCFWKRFSWVTKVKSGEAFIHEKKVSYAEAKTTRE